MLAFREVATVQVSIFFWFQFLDLMIWFKALPSKKPHHDYETMNNSSAASIEQESPSRNAMAASVHSFFRAG